jgi:hypothetical protein
LPVWSGARMLIKVNTFNKTITLRLGFLRGVERKKNDA